jgi:hypothetical protein
MAPSRPARVLITDVRKALATIGKTGTLPAALAAIADVASPVIVLVRVGVDAQGQDDLTMAGIDRLLGAEMETGQRPRILGAPASTVRRSPRTLQAWRASCAASSTLPGKARAWPRRSPIARTSASAR